MIVEKLEVALVDGPLSVVEMLPDLCGELCTLKAFCIIFINSKESIVLERLQYVRV